MIRFLKITHMNFYRRLQGIYRKYYRNRPKVVFRGLKVKNQWESGNEGWIMMLRGLIPRK